MFRIVNIATLMRLVAITTTFISIGAYEAALRYLNMDISVVKVLGFAPWVAFFIILMLTSRIIPITIWRIALVFNPSLYPDLNGTYEGAIEPKTGGSIRTRAIIRQSLLQTEVDIHTETSKSATLESTPIVVSGQSRLHYTYEARPKDPSWPIYTGFTIFDVRRTNKNNKLQLELSGSYFTNRKSIGRIVLIKTSNSVATDVSFY